MLDALLRKITDPMFAALARRTRSSAFVVGFAGLALGLVAIPIIARGFYLAGLAVFLLSRAVAALAAASARQAGVPEAGSIALDAVNYAAVPFAFALADPTAALPATFLIFALAGNYASAVAEGRGPVGNAELLAGMAVACVKPDWSGAIAYILGVLCFFATGVRVAALFAKGSPS